MNYNIGYDGRGDFADEIVRHILRNRGVDEKFLHPEVSDMLPLDSLKNIGTAYDKLMKYINDGADIAVLADTDTDGVTAGAIMYRYLKDMGVEPKIYINHGKAHGVSFDEDNYLEMINSDLLIVVDSLNATVEEYKDLRGNNTDVIVLDHHNINPDVKYDDYITLVSSQDMYNNPQLSGAGVVWKFCKYVDSKQDTKFADNYVDLAAVGIAADVMDMTVPENRYIVYTGLNNLQNLALKKIVGSYEFNSRGILFSVAPLINSANRLDENEAALSAMIEDDNKTVLRHIRTLKKCKESQDQRVSVVLEEVQKDVDRQVQHDAKFLFVQGEGIGGLSGLVATKLSDKYDRPTFVVTYSPKFDVYAGSLRCNDNFDLAGAVNASGLAKAMGHEGAAGFELQRKNLSKFIDYMDKALENRVADMNVDIDVLVNASDFDLYLAEKIHDIDFVSGKNFKPVMFLVDGISKYQVGTWKEGRHLVLDCGAGLNVIKWNSPYSTSTFEDASLFEEPFEAYGTIQTGGFGRKKKVWLIAEEIELETE